MSNPPKTMQFQWKLITDPDLMIKAAVALNEQGASTSSELYSFPIEECTSYLKEQLKLNVERAILRVVSSGIINTKGINDRNEQIANINRARAENDGWGAGGYSGDEGLVSDKEPRFDLSRISGVNAEFIINACLGATSLAQHTAISGWNKKLVIDRKHLETAGFTFADGKAYLPKTTAKIHHPEPMSF